MDTRNAAKHALLPRGMVKKTSGERKNSHRDGLFGDSCN
jgi:hypothetical protein